MPEKEKPPDSRGDLYCRALHLQPFSAAVRSVLTRLSPFFVERLSLPPSSQPFKGITVTRLRVLCRALHLQPFSAAVRNILKDYDLLSISRSHWV